MTWPLFQQPALPSISFHTFTFYGSFRCVLKPNNLTAFFLNVSLNKDLKTCGLIAQEFIFALILSLVMGISIFW